MSEGIVPICKNHDYDLWISTGVLKYFI